jgi:RimJ/RimL family protein N-acetyltransferase
MKSVVYGQDERVLKWVGERIGELEFSPGAIGIGLEEDGELIAGVVFSMYTKASICMHVAAIPGKRWMTKEYLWRVFAYPFIQLNCNRVTGFVREDNLVAQKFDEHIGFKREGLIRKGAVDGTNFILYGMLKEECRWLGVKV